MNKPIYSWKFLSVFMCVEILNCIFILTFNGYHSPTNTKLFGASEVQFLFSEIATTGYKTTINFVPSALIYQIIHTNLSNNLPFSGSPNLV